MLKLTLLVPSLQIRAWNGKTKANKIRKRGGSGTEAMLSPTAGFLPAAKRMPRNCQPAGPVWLNPENEINASEITDAA